MLKAELITYYEREQRPAPAIRTFLISDNRLFIDAITDLTRGRMDFSIVGSITGFGLAQHRFKNIQLSSVDILLIDATVKEVDAVQITRRLRDDFSEIKIVILGLDYNEATILEFVEAGAVGYVLKQSSIDDISSTLIAIHNGQTPC